MSLNLRCDMGLSKQAPDLSPDVRPERPLSERMPGRSVGFDSTRETLYYSIDFEPLAIHLGAIEASTTQQGVSRKVIVRHSRSAPFHATGVKALPDC